MRLWQWGLDVRAVTYATLITLRWLQVEGFLHSEECSSSSSSSSSSSKECSTSNRNSNFSSEDDHDIRNKSNSEKVKNTTNEDQNDNNNNPDKKINENTEEKNTSKNLNKKMNEKVEKNVQIGRNGNDYFNRHSQWISNARKICLKISENTKSFPDEFLGAVEGKEN